MTTETWLHLRRLLDNLESNTAYEKVDRISQRVFEWIYIRGQRKEPLYVQEVIFKSEVASPATLHKSIECLEQLGLLKVSVDKTDNRRRIVQTTTRAKRLMDELSKGVESWAVAMASSSSPRDPTTERNS